MILILVGVSAQTDYLRTHKVLLLMFILKKKSVQFFIPLILKVIRFISSF